MKKEKFNYLYSFKYKNKDYIYLISKNYPFYFLEYNTSINNFEYPDINTFQELYKKFYSNNQVLSFDIKSELNDFRKKLFNIDFNLVPLVRTTSGLLSVILVLSMCGCNQTSNESTESDTNSVSYDEMLDKNEEIYNYFKSYNMDVISKEYDGNDYIFVRDFINDSNKHQITIQTHEEFRNLHNMDFILTGIM